MKASGLAARAAESNMKSARATAVYLTATSVATLTRD